MLEAEDVKVEVVCFGDKDTTVEAKESCRVNGPTQGVKCLKGGFA